MHARHKVKCKATESGERGRAKMKKNFTWKGGGAVPHAGHAQEERTGLEGSAEVGTTGCESKTACGFPQAEGARPRGRELRLRHDVTLMTSARIEIKHFQRHSFKVMRASIKENFAQLPSHFLSAHFDAVSHPADRSGGIIRSARPSVLRRSQ